MESTIKIFLGLFCIVIGILLIIYYQKLLEEKKQGGLSFKLRTAGIGFIIIGIGLIVREF